MNNSPLPFTALILAGGRSSRMGRDKALEVLGRRTLLQILVDRLSPLTSEIFIVTRSPHHHTCPGAQTLTDSSLFEGPLSGLVTGLEASSQDWSLALGCDMPFVEPEALRRLFSLREENDAVALSQGGFLQPLHAFYSLRCLPPARTSLASGERSLRGLLQKIRLRTYSPKDAAEAALFDRSCRDLDTPQELEEARRNGQVLQAARRDS